MIRKLDGMRCASIALLTAAFVVSVIVDVDARFGARQAEEFTNLEAQATRALRVETESFSTRAALVARLQTGSERAPNGDQRARLALLWLRAVRSLLASVPFGDSDQQPYRDWLAKHDTVVTYSEPAGQWLLLPDVVWRVHDAHKSAESAEAIAWFAVENGYTGECEGYIPCYANIMNRLDGEYLRRHPRGCRGSEAVAQVHSSLVEAVKSLSGRFAASHLNPSTDCGDLKAGLEPLRQAILESNADRRSQATVRLEPDATPEFCRRVTAMFILNW